MVLAEVPRTLRRPSPREAYEQHRLYELGRSPFTVSNELRALRLFASWLDRDPTTAEPLDIRAFLADSRSRCTAETTINRLCILHAFFRWCRPEDDPTTGIRIARPRAEPKQPYTLAELRRLVAACKTPRNRAIVLLLIATGMRLGELVGLRAEHIDWEAGLLRIEGKGQRRRWVAPGRVAMDALRLYSGGPTALRAGPVWDTRLGRPLTRQGAYQAIRAIGAKAGVRKVFVHRFRTTWANVFFAETNGDAQAAQVLMGHSKIETTMHYASWSKAERALEVQRSLADKMFDMEAVV